MCYFFEDSSNPSMMVTLAAPLTPWDLLDSFYESRKEYFASFTGPNVSQFRDFRMKNETNDKEKFKFTYFLRDTGEEKGSISFSGKVQPLIVLCNSQE